MRAIKKIRRRNFARIVRQFGGPREAAIKLDMNESQVSQLISETTLKGMGDNLATEIEKRAGLAPGTLDMPVSANGLNLKLVPIVEFGQLDALRADPNTYLSDMPQLSEDSLVWDNSSPAKPRGPMFAVRSPDNALHELIAKGDLVIIDTGAMRPQPGSIVLVEIGNGTFVLRVIRENPAGGYILAPTSELYAPIRVPDLSGLVGTMIEVRWSTIQPNLL